MPQKISASEANFYLGFDGGGTKTECVLADAGGSVLARAFTGASNPLRAGYMRAWFALSEAADCVLSRHKLHAAHIGGICAGLGGAGTTGVARRATAFFEGGFPNAHVRVTTDLDIAHEAAFGSGEGILLLAGTGSAALGRDAAGRNVRAGGHGPWISDEGGAFDIGRRAFEAVVRADEGRGPETALSKKIFEWHQATGWGLVRDSIAKNPDDIFPKTFPLVAQLADKDDAVSRQILSDAAASLAGLAAAAANQLGWHDRETPIAKVGGVYGRSKFFDSAIAAELEKALPLARFVPVEISPAEAAVRMAIQSARAKGNAA
ncbi:MAG TPA: BadF/BadG/BcrA/BcrD ATPase family protein [Candidatus Dormibacteraeota bacterium]|nr:BadF/BadG/BcrA/BcrD ATPase family protein [Candidatus Dormibacteraeota bacterium]